MAYLSARRGRQLRNAHPVVSRLEWLAREAAKCSATPPAPAALARNTSTATGRFDPSLSLQGEGEEREARGGVRAGASVKPACASGRTIRPPSHPPRRARRVVPSPRRQAARRR